MHIDDHLREIQVGVGVSMARGGYVGLVARTTPYVQYFIKDRWSFRLEGEYETYQLTKKRDQAAAGSQVSGIGARSQGFGIGLSTQYYFLKRDRFALYGKGGYNYGKTTSNFYDPTDPSGPPTNSVKSNCNRFSLGVGAQYRLRERWLINGLIEQQASYSLGNNSTNVSLGVGFRIK